MREFIKNQIVNQFHNLYYRNQSTIMKNTWFGVPIQKCPEDLQMYQEIIFETKPDFIIETGTNEGGSALFFANMLDLLEKGKVITIDLYSCAVSHPRIHKLIFPSIDQLFFGNVKDLIGRGRNNLVVLDSNHEKEYVKREIEMYSELVGKGGYLVVEDTNINGHPVLKDFGSGPMEAVIDFLKTEEGNKFEIDRDRERLMLTMNPSGWLRRMA